MTKISSNAYTGPTKALGEQTQQDSRLRGVPLARPQRVFDRAINEVPGGRPEAPGAATQASSPRLARTVFSSGGVSLTPEILNKILNRHTPGESVATGAHGGVSLAAPAPRRPVNTASDRPTVAPGAYRMEIGRMPERLLAQNLKSLPNALPSYQSLQTASPNDESVASLETSFASLETSELSADLPVARPIARAEVASPEFISSGPLEAEVLFVDDSVIEDADIPFAHVGELDR